MKQLCRVFGVHRSSFNYWNKRKPKTHYRSLQERAMVQWIFRISKGSAGARTVAQIASDNDVPMSRFVARKHMLDLELVSCQPSINKHKNTGAEHATVLNLLNRQFSPSQPNQVWCGDITYIWTGTRWAYLAVVLDLYARHVVGWALSESPDSDLTCKALRNAFESRGKPKGLLFHSDQGCQYTSKQFREKLAGYGISQSMSRRANCWDNAPMERFFRSFKTEWMPKKGYTSLNEAHSEINSYITNYYSEVRPHTFNNGLAPKEAEAVFYKLAS